MEGNMELEKTRERINGLLVCSKRYDLPHFGEAEVEALQTALSCIEKQIDVEKNPTPAIDENMLSVLLCDAFGRACRESIRIDPKFDTDKLAKELVENKDKWLKGGG